MLLFIYTQSIVSAKNLNKKPIERNSPSDLLFPLLRPLVFNYTGKRMRAIKIHTPTYIRLSSLPLTSFKWYNLRLIYE